MDYHTDYRTANAQKFQIFRKWGNQKFLSKRDQHYSIKQEMT